MKINYTHLAFIVLSFLVSIYLLILVSCSPNYHMKKFINKGGVIKNDTTIVTLTDTIKGADGKDSIIYRQVSVNCPELQAPLTRYEIRYQYKTLRDTLKVIKYDIKWKTKQAVKTLRNDKKKSFGYNLRFIGVIAFLILLIVILFKFK